MLYKMHGLVYILLDMFATTVAVLFFFLCLFSPFFTVSFLVPQFFSLSSLLENEPVSVSHASYCTFHYALCIYIK